MYPIYLDSEKSAEEGRLVAKNKAVQNPTAEVLAEAAKSLGFECVVEVAYFIGQIR